MSHTTHALSTLILLLFFFLSQQHNLLKTAPKTQTRPQLRNNWVSVTAHFYRQNLIWMRRPLLRFFLPSLAKVCWPIALDCPPGLAVEYGICFLWLWSSAVALCKGVKEAINMLCTQKKKKKNAQTSQLNTERCYPTTLFTCCYSSFNLNFFFFLGHFNGGLAVTFRVVILLHNLKSALFWVH